MERREGTWGKEMVTEPRMKEKQNYTEKWELLARIRLGNGGQLSCQGLCSVAKRVPESNCEATNRSEISLRKQANANKI